MYSSVVAPRQTLKLTLGGEYSYEYCKLVLPVQRMYLSAQDVLARVRAEYFFANCGLHGGGQVLFVRLCAPAPIRFALRA